MEEDFGDEERPELPVEREFGGEEVTLPDEGVGYEMVYVPPTIAEVEEDDVAAVIEMMAEIGIEMSEEDAIEALTTPLPAEVIEEELAGA